MILIKFLLARFDYFVSFFQICLILCTKQCLPCFLIGKVSLCGFFVCNMFNSSYKTVFAVFPYWQGLVICLFVPTMFNSLYKTVFAVSQDE